MVEADAGVAPVASDASAARPESALDRVHASVGSLAEIPASEAAWLRVRVLDAILEATGALPSPTPPRDRDGATIWGLITVTQGDIARVMGVCERVTAGEPRVACATDMVEWSGSERARVVLGWRATAGQPAALTLAQPLRALSRVGGTCLVHAERTLRTLDLTVRVADTAALGRALALLTVSPGLSDLIVARTEPHGAGLEAVLSWPLDGRDADHADMGDDAWPERCDGSSTAGTDVAARTAPVARLLVTGTRAKGAVLAAGRREWVVTLGDHVAAATLLDVNERGASVRLTGRALPVLLPWRAPRR